MRRAILAAIVFLVASVATMPVARAEGPVVTATEVQAPDRVTVGDRVLYKIKVEADRGASVTLAGGALPPALTLTGPPLAQVSNLRDGRVQITLTLEVAPFAPGSISVPPLGLSYRGPDGAVSTLQTAPTVINVESVLPDSGEIAPRDLKPQEQVGNIASGWLLPTLISVLVLLVVVVAFWVWERRRLRRSAVAPPRLEPAAVGPEDRARSLLDRAGSDFISEADYVAYYSSIAETVRRYLTERFQFPAFALTTRELQERMVASGVDRWQARLVSGLLSQCDAVVYARYRPASERADADLTAAYEIVEMSRPEAVPEPEAALA